MSIAFWNIQNIIDFSNNAGPIRICRGGAPRFSLKSMIQGLCQNEHHEAQISLPK